MAEFKSKRRCLNIAIPKQEESPVVILESTQWELHFDDNEFFWGPEHFLLEGDNQRSISFSTSADPYYCIPYCSVYVDNDKQLIYYFRDSKKCEDFDAGKYIPWPLARE